MRDWIDTALTFLQVVIVVGMIGLAIYGVHRVIKSDGERRTMERCSTMAWRAAKSAGIEAGSVAESVCRSMAE